MVKSDLEKRLAELKQEVATLRRKLEEISRSEPWWERIAGTFQDDAINGTGVITSSWCAVAECWGINDKSNA